MSETIHFHFVNIPASPSNPFVIKVAGNQVYSTTETQKSSTFSLKVTPSGLSAIHREFVNFLIPEADIDDLQQYDFTNRGYHLRLKVKTLGELTISQSESGDVEGEDHIRIDEQRKFYVDEKTGEYTYKYNKPAYLSEGYEKSPKAKIQKQLQDSVDFGTDSTRIWLHLSGIEADEEDPFEILDVDNENKILFRSTKPIYRKKEVMMFVRRADPNSKTHVANLHIKLPSVGVDTVADFDLTTLGTHIMIAVLNEGSNVEIQQRNNKFFDEQFFNPVHYAIAEKDYKERTREKVTTKYNDDSSSSGQVSNVEAKAGESASLDDVTLTVYVNNIPATKNDPFTIFINDDEFFKTNEEIPKTRTTVLKASFDKPKPGDDLIVEVRFKIDAKDVDTKQQFNLTKNGTFLYFAIEQVGDAERIQMKLQHKDTFGPNTSSSNEPSIKGGSSKDGTVSVFFHLANINASEEKPFELFVNGQQIYKQTQSLGERTAIVTGKIPHSGGADLKITVRAVSKLDGLEEEADVNVSKYGNYLKLEVSDDHSVIDFTQADNDNFDNATTVDTKKMPTKPVATKTAPATTTTASGGSEDYLDVLKKLGDLRNAGILTEEEFQAKKKKILGL